MAKKIYKLTVEPLTCVHIGSGNKLTLLDYTVCRASANRNLYAKFSSDKILHRIATDAQKVSAFERASGSGNMKMLHSFFQNNVNVNEDAEYLCDVTSEFSALYTRNKEKDPYDNAAVVEQMYRPGDSAKPVIPGSSLKGAVRTAVLNNLMGNLSDKDYDGFRDELENCRKDSEKRKLEGNIQKKLLGKSDAKNDPFRAVEIADCCFKAKGTQIVGLLKTVSTNSHSGELFVSNTMQVQAEAIKGSLMGPCGIGESIMRINEGLQLSEDRNGKNAVSKALSISDIACSCNYFYWREFEKEYNKFYKDSVENCDLIVKLKGELDSCRKNKNQFIIRVGHWSQVEFVTFEENFRSPKTRMIRGKALPYGTTRTLFNYDGQYLPLGWCKCSIEEI